MEHPALIISDGNTNSLYLQQILEEICLPSRFSNYIVEALNVVTNAQPGILFIDQNLRGMKGYQLCFILRQVLGKKDVPIALCLQTDCPFDKKKAEICGVNYFMPIHFTKTDIQMFLHQSHIMLEK